MDWSTTFEKDNCPTEDQISSFIGNPLWNALNAHLKEKYSVQPKISYSACSMQKGWNIKYQKSGKSLCTLYPMDGFFIALVVVGAKESTEAELLMPFFSQYTQELYRQTTSFSGAKWLMMEIRNEDVVQDAQHLIALRIPVHKRDSWVLF